MSPFGKWEHFRHEFLASGRARSNPTRLFGQNFQATSNLISYQIFYRAVKEIQQKTNKSSMDNILFRLGYAPTIPGARQLVNHKHILVD